MNDFNMPAISDLAAGRQRVAQVKELGIFDENQYYSDVYLPILEALGVTRRHAEPPANPQSRPRRTDVLMSLVPYANLATPLSVRECEPPLETFSTALQMPSPRFPLMRVGALDACRAPDRVGLPIYTG